MGTKCAVCGRMHDERMRGQCPRRVRRFCRHDDATQDERAATTHGKILPLAAGTTWNDFRIVELIGAGGMAAVYKARHRRSEEHVALKVVLPARADDERIAARFEREAKAMTELSHPDIVRAYASGRDLLDGRRHSWISMEYVDGVSLGYLLRARRFAPDEVLRVIPQICDALEYAHRRGVIHRDLTPANILIAGDGRVKIVDFGVAKVGKLELPTPERDEDESSNLTRVADFLGTKKYASPEQQANASDVDQRTDIYSLGVIFYAMLTGSLPAREWEPPSEDARLNAVVRCAMAHDREVRYRSAAELKAAVDAITAPFVGREDALAIARLSEAELKALVARGELRVFWEQGNMRFGRAEVEGIARRLDRRLMEVDPPRTSFRAMLCPLLAFVAVVPALLGHRLRDREEMLPAWIAYGGWIVLALVAVGLGGAALVEIERGKGRVTGRRWAWWGITLAVVELLAAAVAWMGWR